MIAIAHRGEWSSAPENTLAAFLAAERAGADMVELDVRRTADGAVVVVHDRTLERIWGTARAVARVTRAELHGVGGKHRIPELADVLAAVTVPVMIDYTEADVVDAVLEVVEDAGALERVLFSGRNLEGHLRLRRRAPGARIALTWESRRPPPASLVAELEVEYFNPCHDIVEPLLVEAMHARGLRVSTWTVDTTTEIERVLDAGVDAIISNRIGELVRVLAARRFGAEGPC